MIFVVLGTQDKSFERLLIEVERQIKKGNIQDKVIVQSGNTKYKSDVMEIIDFVSMKEFEQYIKKSKYVITHGGVGTILDALKKNKKIIAVPRLKEYEEHENNHQLEIIKQFEEENYLLACYELKELDIKIKEIRNFKPKKYIGNNEKMINLISDYIEKL